MQAYFKAVHFWRQISSEYTYKQNILKAHIKFGVFL